MIDVRKAIILYDAGRSWDYIGRVLAAEQGRPMRFWGHSVCHAVRAYDRRATTSDEASSRPSPRRSASRRSSGA